MLSSNGPHGVQYHLERSRYSCAVVTPCTAVLNLHFSFKLCNFVLAVNHFHTKEILPLIFSEYFTIVQQKFNRSYQLYVPVPKAAKSYQSCGLVGTDGQIPGICLIVYTQHIPAVTTHRQASLHSG